MRKFQIAALVALAVAIVAFCMLEAGPLLHMQSGFLGILSPITRSGSAVKSGIGSLGKDLMTLDQLQAEYERALAENRRLRAENNGLRDLQKDNDHLREVLGYRERSSFRLVPATVLGHDAGAWWSTIKINKGIQGRDRPRHAGHHRQGAGGKDDRRLGRPLRGAACDG